MRGLVNPIMSCVQIVWSLWYPSGKTFWMTVLWIMMMKQRRGVEEHVAHDSPSVFLFCLHDAQVSELTVTISLPCLQFNMLPFPKCTSAQPSWACAALGAYHWGRLLACNGSDLVCALQFLLHNCVEMRRCLELLKIMTETRHAFGDLEKMKPSKLSFLVVLDIVLLCWHLEHLVAVMVDLLVMMVLVAIGAVGALDSGGGGGGEERKGNWRRPRRSWRCGTIWERGPPLCACNPNQARPWAAILEMSSDRLWKDFYSMKKLSTQVIYASPLLDWLNWLSQCSLANNC